MLMWPQAPLSRIGHRYAFFFSKTSVLCSLNNLVFIAIMISLYTDSSHGDPFFNRMSFVRTICDL